MPDPTPIADLERRLAAAEKTIGELKTKKKGPLEILQVFMPIIAGVLLVVVGYFLTGSVNNAINRQKLELSQVSEMRDLILKLGEPGASRATLEANALALSAFGAYAVPPLLNLLQGGGDTSYLAAKEGLRAVGIADQAAVCERLTAVLENRTRLYELEVHLAAIEISGELACLDVLPLLEDYRRTVTASLAHDDLMPYAGWLRARPAPDRAKITMVDRALKTAVDLLHRQPGP